MEGFYMYDYIVFGKIFLYIYVSSNQVSENYLDNAVFKTVTQNRKILKLTTFRRSFLLSKKQNFNSFHGCPGSQVGAFFIVKLC